MQLYQIDNPQVYELDQSHSQQSLYGFVNSQLGHEQMSKLKIKQETPVRPWTGKCSPSKLPLANGSTGLAAMVSRATPTVLRLDFPSLNAAGSDPNQSRQAQVAAFVVR